MDNEIAKDAVVLEKLNCLFDGILNMDGLRTSISPYFDLFKQLCSNNI